MKNNLLEYPESVHIDGRDYALHTDFSVWIEIEQQFLKGIHSGKTMAQVLAMAYRDLPGSFEDAVRGLMWFYSEGALGHKDEPDGYLPPAYDLKKDFEYIRAGFLSEFGIDLLHIDMHWWQFKRLLSCLGEGCRFSQIVAYRRTDTSKIKNRELRSFYQKMKKRYRLPDVRTREEKEADMARKMECLF